MPKLIFVQSLEQLPHCNVLCSGWVAMGKAVLSRRYLTRQASALIRFAKSINNPELAAVLVDRAADFKEKADEKMAAPNPNLQASDVELSPD
jgi:hypothetical protein